MSDADTLAHLLSSPCCNEVQAALLYIVAGGLLLVVDMALFVKLRLKP